MIVKQISIFIENKSGRLSEVTRLLGENQIDISALSIADTTDYGILRLIVNDPNKAETILKESEFIVSITDVLAIAIDDKPGELSRALSVLETNDISIEYMYAFTGEIDNKALVVLKIENEGKAIKVLTDNNICVMTFDDLF
jgi:hypothetical protein